MDVEFALKSANEWEAAWNSHDLERILARYTDDVVFQSPYVLHRLHEPSGELRGKDALRAYFGSGFQGQLTLQFTVDDVRLSVDTLVINYRNQRGHLISEVLKFRGELVSWGCGAYVLGDALAATRILDS
jgi:ketosteroid isomerase-like protein